MTSTMESSDPTTPRPRRVPGVRDVALRANVSRGTVSNVINHPDRVKPATRLRVFDAIDELGFVPDGNARSLSLGSNEVIGLIVPGLRDAYFVDLARGAQVAAQDAGYTLLIAVSLFRQEEGAARENANIEYFDSTRAAGIVVAPVFDMSQTIKRAQRRGRQVVAINVTDPALDGCQVVIDEERAGYLAAQELLSMGRRSLAWAGQDAEYEPIRRRLAGARAAVDELAPDAALRVLAAEGLTPESGVAAAHLVLDEGEAERPDGIVTATAGVGAALLRTLTDAGIAVPAAVAIASCEGNDEIIHHGAPLTAAEVSGHEVGEAAVKLLIDEREATIAHVHRVITMRPELTRRSSTTR